MSALLSEPEILQILSNGPRHIYGGPARDLYYDMQNRGLIEMKQVRISSQETAIEVRLAKADYVTGLNA